MLFEPIELPCGVVLPNRIAKGAMTEGLANERDDPTADHVQLYERWASGGAGLLLTGNVMVDRRYLERPGNVVLDAQTDHDALRAWATAAGETQLWMQLNHPGRQCQRTTASQPVAPSDVGLKFAGFFGKPRALTHDEIEAVIGSFRDSAAAASAAGFTGVQVHSAHGYLGSQFLSPIANRRTDQWGGSLENRARFLRATVRAVREAVGAHFPVSVKLNSSDFQRGGLNNEEAAQVAAWMQEDGVDLLEISGGTYETVAFIEGVDGRASSQRKREAYFLEYAKLIRDAAPRIPLMVTGGFRTPSAMEEAVRSGEVDVVGIARPFCLNPNFPRELRDGATDPLPMPEHTLSLGPGIFSPSTSNKLLRLLNVQANTAWYYQQILHLAAGTPLEVNLTARTALARHLKRDTRKAFARSRAR